MARYFCDSDFRPVIHLNRTRRPVDFSPIKQRLLRFPSQRRMRFTFASYNELLPVARIGVILEIARIFSPISIDGILFITEAIFGNANYEEMKHIISLTVAVEYLSRVGELSDLFVFHENSKPIFALRNPEEINRLRISVLDFYRQHFPNLYALLEPRGHEYIITHLQRDRNCTKPSDSNCTNCRLSVQVIHYSKTYRGKSANTAPSS